MHELFKVLTILVMAVLWACDDDDPAPINPEELITTVNIELTPDSGPVITLQSQDLDGDGPNAPVITVSGDLAANTVYQGTAEFLNETVSPPEDVTAEIRVEASDHQVFYTPGGALDVTTTYQDQDANGFPVGLEFELNTGAASSGNLTVTLRHEPVKDATGVSDGDITSAGGDTDLDQTFSLTIQ